MANTEAHLILWDNNNGVEVEAFATEELAEAAFRKAMGIPVDISVEDFHAIKDRCEMGEDPPAWMVGWKDEYSRIIGQIPIMEGV